MPKPLKTFIIYSREDTQFKEELLRHLTPFRKNNLLDIWHDKDILPGEKWEAKILNNLKESQIVLMLVSAHSLFSSFIQQKELKNTFKQIRDGKTHIVPILVSECLYEMADELPTLEMLPVHPDTGKLTPVEDTLKWGTRNSAWKVALLKLKELINKINSRIEEEERAEAQKAEKEKKIEIGKYTFHKNGSLLRAYGFEKKLNKKEAELLMLLNEHRGSTVERDIILEKIWGKNDNSSKSQLSNCISNLNKSLEKDKRIEIDNDHGKGYFLKVND